MFHQQFFLASSFKLQVFCSCFFFSKAYFEVYIVGQDERVAVDFLLLFGSA